MVSREILRGTHPAIARFEPLESRRLFAGDVSVFLDRSGNLIVRGDGAANGILVDKAGEFSIAGVDAGGAPTRVNGVANGDVRLPVTGEGDVRLYLGGGDDVVDVGTRTDSVDFPDDLEIYAGDGDDRVTTIGDTNIADDLEIASGAGNDNIRVISTEIEDDLSVLAGDGDDTVQVYGSFADDVLIATGAGRDAVGIWFVDVLGSRVFGPVHIRGGTLIDLGGDDDVLALVDSDFDGAFHANGAGGTDTLAQRGNTFGRRPVFLRFDRRDPAPT